MSYAVARWRIGTDARDQQTLRFTAGRAGAQRELVIRGRVVPAVVATLRVRNSLPLIVRLGDTLRLDVAAIDPFGNEFAAPEFSLTIADSGLAAVLDSARVVGAGDVRIVARHLVPQLAPIIIASATIRVAANILAESGLSYLGLGVGEPTPSWGNMVAGGVSYFRQAWWLVIFPGAAIFCVVMAFNLVGEGLRDLLDPRTRSRR